MTDPIVPDTREPYADPGPRDPADPSLPMPQFQPIDRNDPMALFYSNVQTLSSGWQGDVTGPVSETVRTAAKNVRLHVEAAANAIRDGDLAAFRALRNLDIHPDGRRARSEQAIADAQAKADERIADAQANFKILTACLEQDAMPTVAKGQEMTARQDFMLAISGPGDIADKLKRLAGDDGSIGALATDPSFLRLVFMNQGIADNQHEILIALARETALSAAAKSSNPRRRTAAALLRQAKRDLHGAIVSAQEMRAHVRAR